MNPSSTSSLSTRNRIPVGLFDSRFSYLEPGSLSLLLFFSPVHIPLFASLLALFARAFALFVPCSTFNFWPGAGLVPPLNEFLIPLLLYLSLPIITRTFVAFIQPRFLEGLRHDQTPATVSTYTAQHPNPSSS